MANVYSTRLYYGANLAAGSFTTSAIPAGFVFVVRDIRAQNRGGSGVVAQTALNGVRVAASVGVQIWRTPASYAVTNFQYSTEGRFVMLAGETLTITTGEAGWDVAISGFQLSTP